MGSRGATAAVTRLAMLKCSATRQESILTRSAIRFPAVSEALHGQLVIARDFQ